jgi:iron(II)-dependent oxidoreductase
LSGDVGEGVSSGKGKEIVWTIAVDDFLHVYGENFVIRVLADDGVKPVLGEKIVWEKDGSEMMRIPAGSFEMGDHSDGLSDAPVHRVELDEFYMDSREVTNGQYGVFMEQTGHRKPIYWNNTSFNQTNQPVVGVDWNDAVAYAKWAGKRLPTEAEWEYAAHGGLVGKRYPGGDEISHDDANYDRKVGKPRVVGSYPANGYGLYDMAGNVWEWCQDLYGGDYYSNSPTKNPPGSDTGKYRVLRGGDWSLNAGSLRVAPRPYRHPHLRNYLIGFRCVSGSDFTSDASAGGDFTSDEGAPLYHWQATRG